MILLKLLLFALVLRLINDLATTLTLMIFRQFRILQEDSQSSRKHPEYPSYSKPYRPWVGSIRAQHIALRSKTGAMLIEIEN